MADVWRTDRRVREQAGEWDMGGGGLLKSGSSKLRPQIDLKMYVGVSFLLPTCGSRRSNPGGQA